MCKTVMRADLGSPFHLLAGCPNHNACSIIVSFTVFPCGTVTWHDFAEGFAFLFILLHSLLHRVLHCMSSSVVNDVVLNPLWKKNVLTCFSLPWRAVLIIKLLSNNAEVILWQSFKANSRSCRLAVLGTCLIDRGLKGVKSPSA